MDCLACLNRKPIIQYGHWDCKVCLNLHTVKHVNRIIVIVFACIIDINFVVLCMDILQEESCSLLLIRLNRWYRYKIFIVMVTTLHRYINVTVCIGGMCRLYFQTDVHETFQSWVRNFKVKERDFARWFPALTIKVGFLSLCKLKTI